MALTGFETESLDLCCIQIVLEMFEKKLQPGKEVHVRHTRHRKVLVKQIRDVWCDRFGKQGHEWPWNLSFTIERFIAHRKTPKQKREQWMAKLKQDTLFELAPNKGWIYFLEDDEGRIKIGWTGRDPESRRADLQTGNAAELKLVALMEGTKSQEQRFHLEFASDRLNGEWFRKSPELNQIIKDNMV